jgi:hypothetical protein
MLRKNTRRFSAWRDIRCDFDRAIAYDPLLSC